MRALLQRRAIASTAAGSAPSYLDGLVFAWAAAAPGINQASKIGLSTFIAGGVIGTAAGLPGYDNNAAGALSFDVRRGWTAGSYTVFRLFTLTSKVAFTTSKIQLGIPFGASINPNAYISGSSILAEAGGTNLGADEELNSLFFVYPGSGSTSAAHLNRNADISISTGAVISGAPVLRIGANLNDANAGKTSNCQHHLVAVWSRELSRAERLALIRNPWVLFAQAPNNLPLSAPAAGGQEILPSVGNLALTGYAPAVARTDNQEVAPAAGTLTFTGYAPDVTQTAGQQVIPDVGSIAISGYAPVIVQSTNQQVLPDVGSLTITGYVPDVAQSNASSVTPDVGTVAITGHAPSVSQSANQEILPAVGALAITGYSPAVARTAHIEVAPGVGSLTITGYAPTVTQSAASDIIPGTGTLTITGYAPDIAQSNNLQIVPDVGPIVITAYAPSVTQSANQLVNPEVGSLSIVGYAPTVLQSNGYNIIPDAGTVTLTGHIPTVVQTFNNNIDPLEGSVVITGYAPSVSRTTGGSGGASAADIWTYEIEAGKTAEELMRMIAAVLLGKTTVTDLGGGNAIVTFEAANGSKIRVTATMTGSERTSMSYDDTF